MQLKQKNFTLYQKDFHFYTSYELRVLIAILYILMSVIGDNFLNIILVFNSSCSISRVTAVLYFGKLVTKKYFFQTFALIFNDVFCRNWNLLYSRCRFKHLGYCILLRFI
jgi:hypothetical protein